MHLFCFRAEGLKANQKLLETVLLISHQNNISGLRKRDSANL